MVFYQGGFSSGWFLVRVVFHRVVFNQGGFSSGQSFTRGSPASEEWLTHYVCSVRYSFEGVLQAIYGRDRGELDCSEKQCIFTQASDVLEELDVQHAEFYLDFIILCIFFVILRIGCYLVLRWRVKSQR